MTLSELDNLLLELATRYDISDDEATDMIRKGSDIVMQEAKKLHWDPDIDRCRRS